MVVVGPCPGYTMKLLGRWASFFRECCIASLELSGKSVLPMEPMKRVSPVKTSFSPRRDMLPWLWPGVCITLRMVSPIFIVSPSWRSLSAFGEGFVKLKSWVILLFSPSM